MASIKLDWSGATSIEGIQGYEINYKLSSSGVYLPLTYITTGASSGTFTWGGASFSTSYDFRIRTQDIGGDFSTYKLINNFSTVVSGNLAPTAPTSATLLDSGSSFLNVQFSGATDDFGIQGYEVSYRVFASGSGYTIAPFVTTSSSTFSTSLTSLVSNTIYEIRVRTKDIYDVWSTSYFTTTQTTTLSASIQRSNTNLAEELGFFVEDACGLLTVGSTSLYAFTTVNALSAGNILYINEAKTIPFDGENHIWLIEDISGQAGVIVSSGGVITNLANC